MILDYVQNTGSYIIRVPREGNGVAARNQIKELMRDHGWDYSKAASTTGEAILMSKSPYAALEFLDIATPRARESLGPMGEAVEASWRKEEENVPKICIPEEMELWPFQAHGVAYATDRQHALIGDQPGLGKTAQAVATANEIQASSVLVICPANIRLQWVKMVREWTTLEGRPIIYPVMSSKSGIHPKAHWTIISYDLARTPKFKEVLMQRRYDLLVLDECHYLKNLSAARTRMILDPVYGNGIASCAEKVLGLTGTPLPNRPRECYTITRSMCWDAIDWMSEQDFKLRFNPNWKSREATGRLAELQNRLRANYMVRRLKKDVLTQLPEIMYEIHHVDETGDIRKAMEAEAMLDIDPESLEGANAEILGHISVVRKMMGVAKAPQVADYMNMLLEGGEEKIFLVGWHIEVLNYLQEHLNKWGLVRTDGSTTPFKRQENVDRFVKDPDLKVFLGNMQAVGTGTDGLQDVARKAVICEPSWVPGDIQQVVDRLHRIGQREGVLVEFLVAPGSFDERVVSSAIRKMENIHAALDKRSA